MINKTENLDAQTRAQRLTDDMAAKKLIHKMTNNAPDHSQLLDLYLNELTEWFDHPKCRAIMELKGDYYG